MEQKQKLIQTIAIVGALIVFAYASFQAVYMYSQSVNNATTRSFSVLAQGKATSIPNIATFSFSVVTQGGVGLKQLQNKNTDSMNKAIAFVKSQGVGSKDIKTQQYSIYPRYSNSRCNTDGACPPPAIVGYTVTQAAQVTIRNFSIIGNLLSGVVKNGANQVSQLNFTVENPAIAQEKAQASAIAKAKVKAQAIATAGGFILGKLLTIQEQKTPTPIYTTMRSVTSQRSSVPQVEPGSQKVTVSVTVTYEIK